MKRFLSLTVLAILLMAGLLGAAAVCGRGLVRVPVGHFGLSGDRVLAPGWSLASPFTRVPILTSEGNGALPALPVANQEGVKADARLSFHYRARVEVLARVSRRSGQGFHALLEQAAREALTEVTANLSAAQLLDRSSLEAPLSTALSRRLGEVGLDISSFRFEIRLPEDFRVTTLRNQIRALAHPTGVRLLLIGLDAADWESIDPLLGEGRLPNLKRLIDRGIRGPLRSYNPMVSPLLWNTLATGKGPDVHGVDDFSVLEAKTHRRVPISSRYRKVKALWNILADLNRSAAVVGWWASYPADRIQGYLVSDRIAALSMLPARETLADQPGYTYPADYLGRILPSLVTPQQIPLEEVQRFADIDAEDYAAGLQWIAHPPEPPKDKKEKPQVQDPVGMLLKILTAARNYQAVTLDLLGKGPFDLTAVYFEGIDLVGHRFQHCRPPKMGMVSEAEFRKFRRVVSEYYVYQDRLLGELVRKAATGTTVLVVSDHGFKTGARRPEGILPYTVDQPVEWHREDGIFILSGRGAAQGRLTKQATLFDITPTVLALLGAPVPADMPGRVLDEALDREFLRHHPPARISTYEGLGAARRTEEEGASDRVSAEMMAQLRALGYVGADSPAPKVSGQGASVEPDATPGQEETTVSYHRNLATYYLSRREYEKAIVELNEANRREKLPKSYAMLAEAYDALGRKREALGVLEAGWKEVPDAMATDSILWCVQLSADLGDPERGKRFLEAHRARIENAPAVRDAAEGVLAETAGKMNEAVRLYQAALAADPTLVAAARPLAALYTREGKLEALRPVLEAGLARSERIDEYHNLLGALDSRAGKKEAALTHFRRAAELNPSDSRFALNVALTLMDLQSWEEATTVLEKAMAGAPGGDLALALGDARLKLHQPEAALSSFQAAQRLGADPTRADLGMALSYLAMKRRDDALSFLRESLARRPADAALRQLYQDIQAHP